MGLDAGVDSGSLFSVRSVGRGSGRCCPSALALSPFSFRRDRFFSIPHSTARFQKVLFECVSFMSDAAGNEWTRKGLSGYPNITKHFDCFRTEKKISEYIKERATRELPWSDYAASVRKTLDGLRGK